MTDSLSPATRQILDLAALGRPRPAIDRALSLLADGYSTERLISDVLAPAQREVGILWQTNQWNAAQEHASTAVIDGVLGALAMNTPTPPAPRGSVLVACVEEEYHTVPARMGVELLRLDGWDVTFLGASVPAHDLQSFAMQTEPDAIVLSCTVALFLPAAARCIAAVADLGIPAVAAGAAFGTNPDRAMRLGACGWIGPAVDRSVVLGGPLPRGEPHVQDPESIQLQLQHDALTNSCMTRMLKVVTAMSSYTENQLARSRADVSYILFYLGATLDVGDATLFRDFVSWLTIVLGARGVPSAVLDMSIDIVADTLEDAGLDRASALCWTPATWSANARFLAPDDG